MDLGRPRRGRVRGLCGALRGIFWRLAISALGECVASAASFAIFASMTTTTKPRRKLTIDVDDDVWEKLQATARERQWAPAKLGKLIVRDWGRQPAPNDREAA
jgi:hypothetical protein